MSERGRPRSDDTREQDAARLRQRLWGATVLIALAVVVLPLLLDGSGSESQFRRVEKLREEPPRLVGSERESLAGSPTREESGDAPPTRIRVGEDDPPDYFREESTRAPRARPEERALPRAWVVQAGSFRERENALAVLDTLRRAGHPSFVTDASESGAPLYRVQVGPLVDETSAARLREAVAALLGRRAIVVAYP